jgi:hypothetical protein
MSEKPLARAPGAEPSMSAEAHISANGVDPSELSGDRVPQMAKMPWYPRDFASATRGWPLIAKGAYRELLDAQWDMGSLPADPPQLCAIATATPKEWRIAWPLIEPKLPVGSDNRRRNARLEDHRRRAIKMLEQQRAGGVLGNEKRWGRQ